MREVVELESRRRGRSPTPRELRFDRGVRVILFAAASFLLAYYAVEWLFLHGYL